MLVLLAMVTCAWACARNPGRGRVGRDPLLRPAETKTVVDDEAPLGRLPEDVRPLLYSLNLTVDPRKQVFSGIATIRVELTRPREHLWLHGVGLQVKQAQVTLADGTTQKVGYQQLTPGGVVRIALPAEVQPQVIRLGIAYDAEFARGLRGLYRVEEEGRQYAFSQFEAIEARRAFPCFDEPVFKTPYRITLTIPKDMDAISSTEAEAEGGRGEYRILAFRETERIPTYLLAFAVGEFDFVTREIPANEIRTRSIPLRGVTVRGKGEQIGFAIDNVAPSLEAMERYLGIPYPYEKMDILAVPELEAGAMGNVGLITFREHLVLFDAEDPPPSQLQAYARVLAHELAQMWFGNLVTMRWWDDTWLKEALATWMTQTVLQQLRPGDRLDLALLGDAQAAMETDALNSARAIRQPISSNHDIVSAFERITQHKGGAMLTMYERFVGPEKFREAVASYLKKFAHRSANAEGLIASLNESTEAELTGSFLSFVGQAGTPLIEGRLLCQNSSGRLDLRQSRYRPIGVGASVDSQWQIPICVRSNQGTACLMMVGREASIQFDEGCPEFVMPNADGAGYYRFELDPQATDALVAQGATDALTERERIALVDSLGAGLFAGTLAAPDYFGAIEKLVPTANRVELEHVLEALARVRTILISPDRREAVERFARKLLSKRFSALGYAAKKNESDNDALLRRSLVEFMVFVARDPKVRAEAARRGAALLQAGRFGAAEDEFFLGAAVQVLGAEIVERLETRLTESTNPRERRVILAALARVETPELATRVRGLVLDPRLRANERGRLLLAMSRSQGLATEAWLWLRENFSSFVAAAGEASAAATPRVAVPLCDERASAAMDEFFSERIDRYPGGPRILLRALEDVDRCAEQVRVLRPALERFFAGDEIAQR